MSWFFFFHWHKSLQSFPKCLFHRKLNSNDTHFPSHSWRHISFVEHDFVLLLFIGVRRTWSGLIFIEYVSYKHCSTLMCLSVLRLVPPEIPVIGSSNTPQDSPEIYPSKIFLMIVTMNHFYVCNGCSPFLWQMKVQIFKHLMI